MRQTIRNYTHESLNIDQPYLTEKTPYMEFTYQ
jgi:hypothetical protein